MNFFWDTVKWTNFMCFSHWDVSKSISFNPFSTNPTKWPNTLKQLIGCCWQIIWVCLTILWGSKELNSRRSVWLATRAHLLRGTIIAWFPINLFLWDFVISMTYSSYRPKRVRVLVFWCWWINVQKFCTISVTRLKGRRSIPLPTELKYFCLCCKTLFKIICLAEGFI